MSVVTTSPAPSWLAWLLLIAVASALLSLAYWQYQRADEKAAFMALQRERGQTAELSWLQAEQLPEVIANRPMRLRGRFLPEFTIALDNQIRAGRVGMELLVLFQPEGAANFVLVNLGWVVSDRNGGSALPTAVPSDGEITGVVHQPSRFITLGGPELHDGVWRVGRVETDYWAKAWQRPLVPWVLRLDATVPGGFARDWAPTQAQQIGPDRHRAYAFQWLALALAWCGCWFAFWRKGLVKQ